MSQTPGESWSAAYVPDGTTGGGEEEVMKKSHSVTRPNFSMTIKKSYSNFDNPDSAYRTCALTLASTRKRWQMLAIIVPFSLLVSPQSLSSYCLQITYRNRG
jgi:hypothetical protein